MDAKTGSISGNGALIRFAPQKDWEVNEPETLTKVLSTLDGPRGSLSMADAIVLGGVVGLEQAIADAGHRAEVPSTGGRGDAAQEQTDADSFAVMEPEADAFRNCVGKKELAVKVEEMMCASQGHERRPLRPGGISAGPKGRRLARRPFGPEWNRTAPHPF